MADIRIRQLPNGSGPVASDFIPLDNGTTRRATVQDVVEIGRPTASQAEAEAGINPTKVMTPLTVKQSIASEVGGSIASAAQGLLADSSLQPGDPDSGLNFLQAGTGAVARTTRNKARDVINVLDYGAIGDGTLHPLSERFATLAAAQVVYPFASALTQSIDWAAIQAAVNYARAFSGNVRPGITFGGEAGAKRQFYINSSIDLTMLRDSVGMEVDLNGSVLIGATSGKPVIDMLMSQHVKMRNGGIHGASGVLAPDYGIQLGRGLGTVGDPLSNHAPWNTYDHIICTGEYSGACVINSASELCYFIRCEFSNSSAVAGAAAYIADGRRVVHLTSQFFTVTQPDDTISSFYSNIYECCRFTKQDGTGAGPAIKLYGPLKGHDFRKGYAFNDLGVGVFVSGEMSECNFDIHCEATTILNNYVVDTSIGTSVWRSCKVIDDGMFATDALIKGSGGSGNVFWIDCETSVAYSFSTAQPPLFNKNGAVFRYHGKILLGQGNPTNFYNLSTLNALNGDVLTALPKSNLVLPSVGAYRVTDFNATEQLHRGVQRFTGAMVRTAGVNLTVSSGTLTIPANGYSFFVASGGNISVITAGTADDEGREIFLTFGFSGTLTNDLTPGNTLLAGNYSFVSNNTITLVCQNSRWAEKCRSANVSA